MPICHDREIVRPLLLRDELGTPSMYNMVFGRAGAKASWVRVDDLEDPRAVICRWRWMYLYATSPKAAERLVADLPRRYRVGFAATPARLIPAVKKARKMNWTALCYMYVLDPKRLVVDRRHKIGFLRPADTPLVAKYWPHGKSRRYVGWRIRVGPTCAVRRKGKLVAWALTHGDGAMGMLHVLDEYRGQGMARSITTALAERITKRGLKPFLYIVKGNRASINLTESMGFTRYGTYAWFGE
jgi:8-oxo-dGTP diphosphatase